MKNKSSAKEKKKTVKRTRTKASSWNFKDKVNDNEDFVT